MAKEKKIKNWKDVAEKDWFYYSYETEKIIHIAAAPEHISNTYLVEICEYDPEKGEPTSMGYEYMMTVRSDNGYSLDSFMKALGLYKAHWNEATGVMIIGEK